MLVCIFWHGLFLFGWVCASNNTTSIIMQRWSPIDCSFTHSVGFFSYHRINFSRFSHHLFFSQRFFLSNNFFFLKYIFRCTNSERSVVWHSDKWSCVSNVYIYNKQNISTQTVKIETDNNNSIEHVNMNKIVWRRDKQQRNRRWKREREKIVLNKFHLMEIRCFHGR